MELLQYRKYKPSSLSVTYLHEIKTHIEGIIELCQEGKISVYEADNVIIGESLCCFEYQAELEEKLGDLENDTEEPTRENIEKTYWEGNSLSEFSPEELVNLSGIGKEWRRLDLERVLGDMEKYNDFLIDAQDKIGEIFESVDYQKNRKAGIKQELIRDGLPISPERTDNIQKNDINITDRLTNHLITLYPEFENDLFLLIQAGYLEKTEKGLHWKKTKQALAEYFESIKPPEMKKMNWPPIENTFREKGLKHNLSKNGNVFKEISKDHKEWLKIKNNSEKE